eukprot:526858-Amorphochlora_amoeboformis.AAC.1
MCRLFGYIVQQFRFPLNAFAVISEDQIIQLQYDNVAPTKQLGFKDLGITKLQPLKGKFLEGLCIVHRGERGPNIRPSGRRTWDEVLPVGCSRATNY